MTRAEESRWRLTHSSMTVIGGTAFDAVALGLSNILVARVLEPQDVGTYYLALTTVAIVGNVAQLGMSRAVVRLVGEALTDGDPRGAVAAAWRATAVTAIAGFMAASVLAASIALGVRSDHIDSPGTLGLLVGGWLFLDTLRLVVAETHRAWGAYGKAALFGNPARSGLLVVLLLLALTFGASLEVVLTFTLAAGGVPLLAGLVTLARRGRGTRHVPTRLLLRVGLTVTVVAGASQLLNQGDLWIVGVIHTADGLALYGGALRLVALAAIPQVAANAILAPLVVRLARRGQLNALQDLLRTSASLVSLPVAVLGAVFLLAGSPLLGAVFGDFYRDGHMVLVLLSVGLVTRSITGSCGLALLLTGHERIVMVVTAIAAVAVLAAEAAIGGLYGIDGVACASGFGVAAYEIVLAHLAKRRLGVASWAFAFPAAAAAGYRRTRQVLSQLSPDRTS